MLECGTTNQEPAKTVHKTRARFDPRRIYTVLLVVPLVYGAHPLSSSLAFTGDRGPRRLRVPHGTLPALLSGLLQAVGCRRGPDWAARG